MCEDFDRKISPSLLFLHESALGIFTAEKKTPGMLFSDFSVIFKQKYFDLKNMKNNMIKKTF